MSVSSRISVPRWALASACVLGGLSLGVVPSAAAAGRPAAPVRAATVSTDLKRATGYSAAQLTARPVCGAARPGRIRCLAQLLTVKRSGRAATLVHAPHASSATAAPQAFTAGFLQSAYDTTWLSANRGGNDTVAIVDAYGDSTAYSDMEQFRAANGLHQIPTCTSTVTTSCFELVNQTGQTSPLPTTRDETGSWNIEESLDIDAVSSLCPYCKILMVEANSDDYRGSPDLETAVATAAALGANQISLSWGADTTPGWTAWASPYSSISSAAILAASGDGSYPGPNVGYPAALADVTAVGGTSLAADASTARGFGESAWAIQKCPVGGGTCGTESGCDTSQAIPAYQNGVTTGCDGRAYNDISADADPNTGLNIYDSQSGSEGCGTTNNMCIVGGTSLATPLTAAAEAVAGVATTSPAWTYSDAALLNDIVAGSDGSCPSGWYLICNAGTGWDGPTGNGSISGGLATGGPVVGGNPAAKTNATDATLATGLYANGESTSYYWDYWPSSQPSSTATPTQTATASGSALQTVSGAACALTPSTNYDYYLVATNSLGSTTGYQGSFTTAASESAPSLSSAAAISGSAVTGQTLTGEASWNSQNCYAAPSYQWQESSSSSGPWTTVGTARTYALTATDLGKYLQFVATESNSAGSSSSTSQVLGPVTAPPPVTTTPTTTTPTTSTPKTPAPKQGTSAPTGHTTTTTSVRFYRCVRICQLIHTHGATTYKPRKADYGRYLKVLTSVTRDAGGVKTSSTSTRWIGPITAATAGDISIGSGARIASRSTVSGATGRALARVQIAKRHGSRLTLVVRRATRAATQTWAYVVSRGVVVSATRMHSLRRPARLTITLRRGQTIRLVAVRA